MHREFVAPDDLTGLLRDFRPAARLAGLTRLAGGSKKGVYRLEFTGGPAVILYVWNQAENYWPARPAVAGDPFADASGAGEFLAGHAVLAAADVRIPALYSLDLSRGRYPGDLALVEDVGSQTLEGLLERDRPAAQRPLALLGEALLAMQEQRSARFGKVAALASTTEPVGDDPAGHEPAGDGPAEAVVLRRALSQLAAAVVMSPPLAAVQPELAALVHDYRAAIAPRQRYGLVHGELGPDHVLLDRDGLPVLIDIEGLTYFDVEWEHAFLRLRFDGDYRGPPRIATSDYPERDWMLECARWHTDWLLRLARRTS